MKMKIPSADFLLSFGPPTIIAVIAVSPTVAGWAVRATIAAPLYWAGLIDYSASVAIATWTLWS